jgi:drug/metabolite transporter (DMT)-like permease
MPLVVAALAASIGMERLSLRGGLGLALATLGVVLVVTAHGVSFSSSTFLGDVLTLGAVVCWATYTVALRRLDLPLSTLAITTWTVVLGSPLLVLAGVPQLLSMDWGATTPRGWAILLYSVVLSLAVSYILWNRSVKAVGSNRTAIFSTLTPLIAMASAMLILGETPGSSQLLGGSAIITGIVIARRGRSAPS